VLIRFDALTISQKNACSRMNVYGIEDATMMKVDDSASSGAAGFSLPQPVSGDVKFNPLLIVFFLETKGGEIRVRCRGCREITPLTHPVVDYLRGIIEVDGRFVPVIDINTGFGAEDTEIGPCSCIVVVRHEGAADHLRTGIIVHDIEEVMQLAAGAFQAKTRTETSVNMHLVVEVCNDPRPHELLAAAHRDLSQEQPLARLNCH